MADQSKKLRNKIDHMKGRIETLYDELTELCPFELTAGGKPVDPDNELECLWSMATRDLGDALVSMVELTEGLDPNPPAFDDEDNQ